MSKKIEYLNTTKLYSSFLEVYPDTKIDYKLFTKVLRACNKKIVELIVKKGYSFRMGYNLGELRIVQFEPKYKKSKNGNLYGYPNWGESKKRKQEIIDAGGTPFESFKDKDGNIIGDNGGEKWVIYCSDDISIRYHWYKQKYRNKDGSYFYVLDNSINYSFTPTKQNKLLLADFRRNNPNIQYRDNQHRNG